MAAVAALPLLAMPAAALSVHPEPANALSLPTWAIHVSSVIEWTAAMALVWRYADVSGVKPLGHAAHAGLHICDMQCIAISLCKHL